jgi:hypothetical protein
VPDDHTHLRIAGLRNRIQHLEQHLARIHEHVGLGPLPERPAPGQNEVATVRRLLAEGKEQEALELHQDLTGQGTLENFDVFYSERAGL